MVGDGAGDGARQRRLSGTRGADQADDITLLVLRYDGQENGPAASAAGNRG